MPRPDQIESHPATAYSTRALAEILTACFEGYIVPLAMDADLFDGRFRRENLDLQASRVMTDRGRPVAIVLIARRGWTARVAAMGIVPSHRNCGVGSLALGEIIDDLHRLGDRRMLLEVIDSNEPALRLYSRLGFQRRRRLVGYRRPADAVRGPSASALIKTDPFSIAWRMARVEEPGLPWLIAPETLAAIASPALGLSLDDKAFAIVEPGPRAGIVQLRALFVEPAMRGRGWGKALVGAVSARFAKDDLVVGANVPEDLAPGFMARTGFEKTPIGQFEMEKDFLRPPAEMAGR